MISPQVQSPQHRPKVRKFQWEPESYTIGQPTPLSQSACSGRCKTGDTCFQLNKTLKARTAGI